MLCRDTVVIIKRKHTFFENSTGHLSPFYQGIPCLTSIEIMLLITTILQEQDGKKDRRATVDRAVEECIEQGILKDFLRKNKAEVKAMSIFEYDEEKVKALWKRESFEEGLEQGKEEGITLTKTVFKLAARNFSPEEIAKRAGISVEKVIEILE